jgi:CRISPR-associated protein Cas1
MQIVLDTYGLSLSVRNGCFMVASGKEKRMVHPDRITSILVTMPCRISSPAILLAATSEIALVICTRAGKPEARLWSPRFLNTSALRRNQYGFTRSSQGNRWMKETIGLKLENQLANIRFLADRKQSSAPETELAIGEIERAIASLNSVDPSDADCIKKIRYYEASAAKQYWQVVGAKLPDPFNFALRAKRNPTDVFNSYINYLYGMLRNQVETSILSLGLDPALGCMHRDGYKLPSLVFDLMEPFRPMTDRLLIEAVLAAQLTSLMETDEMGNYRIARQGRKKLIELFNEKLQKTCLYKKTKTSLLNHILLETRQLADLMKQYEN